MEKCIPLAKDIYIEKGGPNENVLVIGATGTGKSTSVCEPRLLHTTESSIVVPVSKRALVDAYAPLFAERGYKVLEMNLAQPEPSTCGFDALTALKDDSDIMSMAELIYGETNAVKGEDRYWVQASVNIIAAIMGYLKSCDKKLTMNNFLKAYKELDISLEDAKVRTAYDDYFWFLSRSNPECPWPKLFDSIHVASRTASCIISMVNSALAPFLTDTFAKLFNNQSVDIAQIGKEKTVLFVVTSPSNIAMAKYTSIFYSQLFGVLFSEAEKNGGTLSVPVHIICDDLVGCKIPDLAKYISLFRAAGISTTICLQSLAQLASLYSHNEATSIIDNCSTQLFLGSINFDTCNHFATMLDVPTNTVLRMGIGKCICVRAGHAPVITERYATYEDPLYVDAFGYSLEK